MAAFKSVLPAESATVEPLRVMLSSVVREESEFASKRMSVTLSHHSMRRLKERFQDGTLFHLDSKEVTQIINIVLENAVLFKQYFEDRNDRYLLLLDDSAGFLLVRNRNHFVATTFKPVRSVCVQGEGEKVTVKYIYNTPKRV